MSQQNRMKSIKILILFIEIDLRKTSLGSRRYHLTALSLGSTYITDLFLCNDDMLRPHHSAYSCPQLSHSKGDYLKHSFHLRPTKPR
jgi:hypothetical protein